VHRVLNAELNFTSAKELNNFCEEELCEPWQKAMQSIQDNDTWELSTLPAGHRAIDLKWIYKVKHDEASNTIQHKAHLVAKGYVQLAGVDFDKVFVLVACLELVRMLVALAAHSHWAVHHMDVKSVFLNGTIKEELYVHRPPGFIVVGREGMVLRLRKVLYRLR
jgi:hypothetical protein